LTRIRKISPTGKSSALQEKRILLRQKHFLGGAADGRGPGAARGNCIGPEYNCSVDILPVQ
jgi:hypothetical protein